MESQRGLAGDPDDSHSRYIEGGVLIGCLYMPNGNPVDTPKFPYKLRWFERLVKAEVDSFVRGWEKASDHAPVWIEIAEA